VEYAIEAIKVLSAPPGCQTAALRALSNPNPGFGWKKRGQVLSMWAVLWLSSGAGFGCSQGSTQRGVGAAAVPRGRCSSVQLLWQLLASRSAAVCSWRAVGQGSSPAKHPAALPSVSPKGGGASPSLAPPTPSAPKPTQSEGADPRIKPAQS